MTPNLTPHRLREIREAQRLSRPELAVRSGVPAGTIEAYEMKDVEPTVGRLAKLADALGVTLDELAGRTPAADGAAA